MRAKQGTKRKGNGDDLGRVSHSKTGSQVVMLGADGEEQQPWSFTECNEELGEGTFGTVHRGILKRDGETAKQVAVKKATNPDHEIDLKIELAMLTMIRKSMPPSCQFYLGLSLPNGKLITTLAGNPLLSHLFNLKRDGKVNHDQYSKAALDVVTGIRNAFVFFLREKILVRDLSLANVVMLQTPNKFVVKLIDVATWQKMNTPPPYNVVQTWGYLLSAIAILYSKETNPCEEYNKGYRSITPTRASDKGDKDDAMKLNVLVSSGAFCILLLSVLYTEIYTMQEDQTLEGFTAGIAMPLMNHESFIESMISSQQSATLKDHTSRLAAKYKATVNKATEIIDSGKISYRP